MRFQSFFMLIKTQAFLTELLMESFMQPSIFLSDFVADPDAVHRWHCPMENDCQIRLDP
jgi:hypothetical protein